MNPKTGKAKTTRGKLDTSHPAKEKILSGKNPSSQRQPESDQFNSDHLLRATMENIHLIAVILDLEGRVTFCNKFLLQITGYSSDEVLGCDWFAKFVPDVRPDVKEEFSRGLRTGEISAHFENLIRTKNGEERFIRFNNTILHNAQGKIIGTTSIGEDITESKHDEDSILRMNRALRMISTCNQIMVHAQDEKTLLDEICQAIVNVGGYQLAWVGFAEQDRARSVRPAAQAGFEQGYLETLKITWSDTRRGHGPTGTAIRTGEPIIARSIHTDPNFAPWRSEALKRGYASSIALPIKNKEQILGALNVYSTVSGAFYAEEEKLLVELADDLAYGLDSLRNREALRLSEERFHTAFEQSASGMCLTSLEGTLLSVNQAMSKMFGFSKEVLQGKHFNEITHSDDLEIGQDAVRQMMLDEVPSVSFEKRYLRKSGEFFSAHVSSALLKDASGQPFHFITQIEDISERKQAEEALIESEERLRLSTELANVAVWEYSFLSNTMSRSKNHDKLYGLDWQELWDINTFLNATHPDDRGFSNEMIQKSVATGGPDHYKFDFRVVYPDRTIHWLMVTGQVVERNPDGQGTIVRGCLMDITERKQVEQALFRNEHLLRLFVENSPAAIAMFDCDMKYIIASHRYLIDYELEKQEISGRSHYEVFPEIPERWKEIHQRCLAGATERAEEDPFPRAGGKLDWVRWEIRPWYEMTGEIGGIILFSEVITDRVLAKEKIRQSSLELAALLSIGKKVNQTLILDEVVSTAVKEMVKTVEADVVFLFLRKGEKLTLAGISLKKANKKFGEMPWHHVGECICGLAVSKGQPLYSRDIFTDMRCTWEECKKAGYRSFAALPLRSGEEIIGVLGLGYHAERDFEPQAGFLETLASQVASGIRKAQLHADLQHYIEGLEQRVAERTAALQAANKELETFAYTVSHDLKAPLRGIDGYSRLLLEEYNSKLDEEGRQFLFNVRTATGQMNQLIEDLLQYSRLERREVSSGSVNLSALVESLLAERSDEIKQRDIRVTVNIPRKIINADPEGLSLALRNLLDNALKFTVNVSKPVIKINGRESEIGYMIEVCDNGIGFELKYQERIFEIFQRLHRAEEYPGTGIGLAIVRKAMERMGGRVWADSTPGQGATFYLEVPR